MDAGGYIRCKYSCFTCGISRREVDVPIREANQDIITWTQNVMAAVMIKDHATLSPRCRADTLSEVMIPITGANQIGGPCKQ